MSTKYNGWMDQIMSKKKQRVNISMPVYNGERFIAEAIDSIFNQTFPDFELTISTN